MKLCSLLRYVTALLAPLGQLHAAEEPITWLVQYDGKSLPQEQGWKAVGELAKQATLANGGLHLVDDSATADCAFRATWKPQPGTEIVVETTVRVEFVTGSGGSGKSLWPAQQGAPVGVLVCDGQHQEGLLLDPERIGNWHDRVALIDPSPDFHTYRLVIRGNDMSISVDGVEKIRGEGAFWKTAKDGEAYVQFGSTSPGLKGGAFWQSFRLGVRKAQAPPQPKLRITVSQPWEIPPPPGWDTRPPPPREPQRNVDPEIGIAAPEAKPGKPIPPTRPYLYDVGQGVFMISVAQGPDALMEPYGVLKSTDAGKTWVPVKDMQYKTFAPLPMTRLPDGTIMGVSRWTARYDREKGVFIGITHRFDEKSGTFTMTENLIRAPGNVSLLSFDRHIFNGADGHLLAVVYGSAPMIMQSKDQGLTWTHFSTLAVRRQEPAVERLSDTEMTAILRNRSFLPLEQIWSHDGGKTWGSPVTLEVGSVAPDIVLMSNGVLACSYGRPGSNLMFSIDHGKTWMHHTVLTDSGGFNYTAIREVSPGRLLYIHDAPNLRALYVDVERINP